MATNPSPDPRSSLWALIAWYLRVCRESRGQSGTTVGNILGESKATVSRLENGRMRLDETRARTLDRAWSTKGLLELLVWYASIGHDPSWFNQYLDKERRAGVLKIYEANLIHGLLQTEEYTRALFSTGDAAGNEALLSERMARQEIFDMQPPPFVSVVLSQNALEWPVGSPEIMQGQLAHLLELSERTRLALRVVPRTWDVGAYAGLDGSFALMMGDDFGEVAYSESPERGRLVSSPSDVQSYVIRWDRISAKALPEAPSRELIKRLMEKFQ